MFMVYIHFKQKNIPKFTLLTPDQPLLSPRHMDREIMAPILRDPNLSLDAVVILSRIVQHLTRHSNVYM